MKSPLALALTLGIFLALAGGTLAVTGAFSADDEPNASAAQNQYGTTGTTGTSGGGTGATLGVTGEAALEVPGGGRVGGTVGAGVGVGGGGGGVGGAGAGGPGGAGAGGGEGNRICPVAVRVLRGTLVRGSVGDICSSDDARMVIRSGSPTEYEARFDDERLAGSSVESILFEGMNTPSCVQKMSLFNYGANDGKGEWVRVFDRRLGRRERVVTDPVNGSGQYVENGEAKVRVRCDGGEFLNRTDFLNLAVPETG